MGSDGPWVARAARALEKTGSVICGVWSPGTDIGAWLAWLVPLLEECDAVLVWLDGPRWSEWEFGYLLGLDRARCHKRLTVVGHDYALIPSAAHVLAGAMSAVGVAQAIHTDLGVAIGAVEAGLRCTR